LGLLPKGYIYPREELGTRDLARKRLQLVRYRTAQVLAIESILSRETGARMSGAAVKRLTAQQVQELGFLADVTLALEPNCSVSAVLHEAIVALEKRLSERVRLRPEYRLLKTVPGIGEVLATTILLGTGTVSRFARVGNFSSYCRCVESVHQSNGNKKGEGLYCSGAAASGLAALESAAPHQNFCSGGFSRPQEGTPSSTARRIHRRISARAGCRAGSASSACGRPMGGPTKS